jgi:predicted permease
MNYTGGEVVEPWRSTQASADIFRTFGMPLLLGRGFTPEEDLPNGPRVVVISQGLWKRRFASDPKVLGQTVSLSGEPYTVVGIVADSQGMMEMGGASSDVYLPFQIDPNTGDQGVTFVVVARLKPGVTLEQAKERIQTSTADYRTKFPNVLGPKDTFTLTPLREALIGDVRPLLVVLGGAVSLVLLIACANVANLLLVRAVGRRHEIGIRVAIGAGRGRVIRQLLTESVLLSILGGALGLVLGHAGIQALLSVNRTRLPMIGELAIDGRVMSFALAVSLATGIVFGLLPALQASRVDLNSVLKSSGGRWNTGLRHNKTRAALVISEVSLAMILLIGSALLIRSFVALYKVDRGFETTNVISMRTSLTGPKYQKSAAVATAVTAGLARIRSLPGVVAASATGCVPLQCTLDVGFNIIGRPLTEGPNIGDVGWTPVSPGYFEVFAIPVKRGRTFTNRDDGRTLAVVVINEAMARKYWKDGDPLQDRIVVGADVGKDFEGEPVRQIVGIVGDTREGALETVPGPRVYVPHAQLPDAVNAWFVRLASMAWLVRTSTEPRALVPSIGEQLRQVTALPVGDALSMDDVLSTSTSPTRFNMLLMTVFGCAALLLAAIGIYGLMAYTVEQRTQEIGIRLALGAEATTLRNMVVRQGMTLALAGVVIGLGAAWGVSRLMESLLFGVKPRDPVVFVAVPLALGAVALLSVWLPARRALRVDPAVALRHE